MNRFDPLTEAAAEAIYGAFDAGGAHKPAWQPHGNSDKQDEARMLAETVLDVVRAHVGKILGT